MHSGSNDSLVSSKLLCHWNVLVIQWYKNELECNWIITVLLKWYQFYYEFYYEFMFLSKMKYYNFVNRAMVVWLGHESCHMILNFIFCFM